MIKRFSQTLIIPVDEEQFPYPQFIWRQMVTEEPPPSVFFREHAEPEDDSVFHFQPVVTATITYERKRKKRIPPEQNIAVLERAVVRLHALPTNHARSDITVVSRWQLTVFKPETVLPKPDLRDWFCRTLGIENKFRPK